MNRIIKKGVLIMTHYYFPGAQLLLFNETNQTVDVLYNDNPYPFILALIGERPPYYMDPVFQETYPII